ncbi:NlpC/P60 family protein [Thiomicrorhabdus sp.]|uniref:C40 family peptidase n=1 Tax=Thiomicrorhabdus sp. TaxID=2039724 RepID=UPI0029C61732|nr:NlpC/P60 family protein [Thiomicrorhabdus sp.]
MNDDSVETEVVTPEIPPASQLSEKRETGGSETISPPLLSASQNGVSTGKSSGSILSGGQLMDSAGSDVTVLQGVNVHAAHEMPPEKVPERIILPPESDAGTSIIPQTSNLGGSQSKVVLYSRFMKERLSNLKSSLMKIYGSWKGTPYKWGGTSKKGVDCSGFVQATYRSAFKYKLPRTTRTQIKQGIYVERKDLRVGDVLFFKTGPNLFHNGIYLGNNEFMHASTTYGVKISRVDSRYWKKRYLKARRFLNDFESM